MTNDSASTHLIEITPPRVFISYSHDSIDHAKRVCDLSDRLRGDGIDCHIDQYCPNPSEGWPRWMDQQIEKADFVALVFTERYIQRSKEQRRSGVRFESVVVLQDLYEAGMINDKFIPVLFEPTDALHIAKWLRPFSCYIVNDEVGYESLRRRLLNDPVIVKPPLGTPIRIGPVNCSDDPLRDTTTIVASSDLQPPSTAPVDHTPFPCSRLPRTGEFLIGRPTELDVLWRAWQSTKTKLIQIVAPGGVGKTQLVKKWREMLLDEKDHGGAMRAYDWSFFSQGTEQQASADEFFDHALRWLGHTDPTQLRDPWEKGEELARRFKRRRTLLILDGLEPLQHPPGPLAGGLTDPSMQVLLGALAHDNPGMCVITTREAVPDLTEMSEPRCVTIDLSMLDPPDGAELLRRYGVYGKPDELKQASREVRGHSLALILLATFLRDRFHGDVNRRSDALLFDGSEAFAQHAHKVMMSYENWFKRQDDVGRAAVAILYVMGLFSRPADLGCLEALRAEPSISGLTEALFVGNRDQVWQRAVERLRSARLLADEEVSNQPSQFAPLELLDCHPLIREHFAAQLTQKFASAAREAHRRLYEHLKAVPKCEHPDSLQDMMPLYQAVAHGCKAGLYQDALWNVYWTRINRQERFFSSAGNGGFRESLVSLSHFFEANWQKVVSPLISTWREHSFLLSETGIHLIGLGELRKGRTILKQGIDILIQYKEWEEAGYVAPVLANVHVYLGELREALELALQHVLLADASGNELWRCTSRIVHGNVLHSVGDVDNARERFNEAISLVFPHSADWNPAYLAEGLYEYCDFELGQIEQQSLAEEQVTERLAIPLHAAGIIKDRAKEGGQGIYAQSVYHLIQARMGILKAGYSSDKVATLLEAKKQAEASISLLRQVGTLFWFPRALLLRSRILCAIAAACGHNGTNPHAEQDLQEIENLITRTGMCLYMADLDLLRARFESIHNPSGAREHLGKAKTFIDQIGYHCRDWEIAQLQTRLDVN